MEDFSASIHSKRNSLRSSMLRQRKRRRRRRLSIRDRICFSLVPTILLIAYGRTHSLLEVHLAPWIWECNSPWIINLASRDRDRVREWVVGSQMQVCRTTWTQWVAQWTRINLGSHRWILVSSQTWAWEWCQDNSQRTRWALALFQWVVWLVLDQTQCHSNKIKINSTICLLVCSSSSSPSRITPTRATLVSCDQYTFGHKLANLSFLSFSNAM